MQCNNGVKHGGDAEFCYYFMEHFFVCVCSIFAFTAANAALLLPHHYHTASIKLLEEMGHHGLHEDHIATDTTTGIDVIVMMG